MENKIIKILLLPNNDILISEIQEVGSELGQPDCRLINPYLVIDSDAIKPWLSGVTNQGDFMIHSDKIVTIAEPKPTLLQKYEELTK